MLSASSQTELVRSIQISILVVVAGVVAVRVKGLSSNSPVLSHEPASCLGYIFCIKYESLEAVKSERAIYMCVANVQ